MAKEIKSGSTDQTIDVFINDSSVTTGAGLTGLVFNSSGLVCYYRKGATGSATALTLATQTVGGAHSDGGFVEISSSNMPGMYRLDLSDTMVDTAGLLKIMLKGATNMAPVVIEVEVVAVNKYDAVRGGMTALPNANADAAGGLVISDAGGFDIDNRAPSATAVTNLNTVYATDFATNYDATNDRWTVNVKTWNDLTTVALPLAPTVAGRTLDVTATGAAGVDWANVENQSTSVNLSATNIDTDQVVASVSGAVGSVTAGVTLANGAHGGSSATLRLGGSTSTPAFYVTNSGGDAVQFESTGGNGQGLDVLGNGSGHGVLVTGGATGNGVLFVGGGTSGDGVKITTTSGHGLNIVPDGVSKNGITVMGGTMGGVCDGIRVDAGAGGLGLRVDTATVTTMTVTTNAIAWNSGWDAEVQSEVQDAIEANKLDHLVAVADADDPVDNSIIAKLASKNATADWSTFVNTTDALEAIRDAVTAAGTALDAAGIRSAVGLASANLDTQLGDIPTVSEFNARTLVAASYALESTLGSGVALSAAAIDALWDEVMEGSTTARQSMRLANSANGGKLSGAATTNILIRDLADTKNRIDATVDASGNRTAITRDLT